MDNRELIYRYMHGIATKEEVEQLNRDLERDPALRKEFRFQANVDIGLRQLTQEVQPTEFLPPESQTNETHPVESHPIETKPIETRFRPAAEPVRSKPVGRKTTNGRSVVGNPRNQLFRLVTLLAVAAAIIVSCFFAFRSFSAPNSITIVEINGDVLLTANRGNTVDELLVGHRFAGGSLESLSADAWCKIQLADKSTVTISGRSFLTMAQNGGADFRLRYGNLSARVNPRSPGQQMTILTPTAQLDVLGTQFDVDANADSTMLIVNEGSVRAKRLADGETADVAANHQLSVLAEPEEKLNAMPRPKSQFEWHPDLERDAIHGNWSSKADLIAKKIKQAIKSGKMTKQEAFKEFEAATLNQPAGSLWLVPELESLATKNKRTKKSQKKKKLKSFRSRAIVSMTQNQIAPIVAHSAAKLRIQGRVHGACEVHIGFTARELSGGFAGKYVVSKDFGSKDPAADPNKPGGLAIELEIPLVKFLPKESAYGKSLVDKELVEFWVTSVGKAKLEITNIEIIVDESSH